MRFVKVLDGLWEPMNFFSYTPSSQFALDHATYVKTDDLFVLNSGFVERHFDYPEFVLIVQKEQIPLQYGDKYYCYVRQDKQDSGLLEEWNQNTDPIKFWKLIKTEEFVSGFTSLDGITWTKVGGGGKFTNLNIQGLAMRGFTPLKIVNYAVYRDPYLTICNFPIGTTVHLQDNLNNIIETKVIGVDQVVKFYLENNMTGALDFRDADNQIIFYTGLMDFKLGDVYTCYNHELDMYYKNRLLTGALTVLDSMTEIVTLHNLSNTITYQDIVIRVNNKSENDVKISLDNINYFDRISIPIINPNETMDIYIYVSHGNNYSSTQLFGNFYLELDQGYEEFNICSPLQWISF